MTAVWMFLTGACVLGAFAAYGWMLIGMFHLQDPHPTVLLGQVLLPMGLLVLSLVFFAAAQYCLPPQGLRVQVTWSAADPVTLDYSRGLGDWDAAARAEATRRATRVAELEAAAKMKPKPKGRK